MKEREKETERQREREKQIEQAMFLVPIKTTENGFNVLPYNLVSTRDLSSNKDFRKLKPSQKQW